MLDDGSFTFNEWLGLIEEFEVKGKKAHDARLVAAMKVHRIDTVLTLNGRDFRRFSFAEIVSPLDVLQGKLRGQQP